MASSAWTATRADLVKALDIATRERELWRRRAEGVDIRRNALRCEAALRKAEQRQRERERRVLAQATYQARLEQAFASTPPDPNAELHRRTLIAALKEKP